MAQEAAVPRGWRGQVQKMIDDSIARFARSAFLRNASITGGAGLAIREGGGLTVSDGGGVRLTDGGELSVEDGGTVRVLYPEGVGGGVAVYYGRLVSAVDGSYLGTGMLVQTPDSTDIASFSWDAVTGGQTAHLHDGQNNVIVSNNKAAGWGLSRPWIPGVFYGRRYADFRYSTTSNTFETLVEAGIPRQHSHVVVGYRVSADTSGTTGEVRVLLGGVPAGSPTSEGFAIGTRYTGLLPVPAGVHMDSMTVEIQARRTGGTGAIRLEPVYLYSRGT